MIQELEEKYKAIKRKVSSVEEEGGGSLMEILQENHSFFALLKKVFAEGSLAEQEKAAKYYQEYLGKILSISKKGGKNEGKEGGDLVALALEALKKAGLDPSAFPR